MLATTGAGQLPLGAVAVLTLLVVLAAALTLLVRRWFSRQNGNPPTLQQGLTLDQLRRMHRTGLISDQEFQRLRELAVGQVCPAPPALDQPNPR